MRFDSHVSTLLAAAVALVNGVTPGHDGTRVLPPPSGRGLATTVSGALVSQGRHARVSAAQATELARYADDVRSVFEAASRDDVDAAATGVNDLLERTSARPRLDRSDAGWGLHFHGADDGVVLGWAAGLASALALCIGSDLAGRLGVCSAAPCDRVFVDESKNGTRRFCSTRCQNRVKAANHRARRP